MVKKFDGIILNLQISEENIDLKGNAPHISGVLHLKPIISLFVVPLLILVSLSGIVDIKGPGLDLMDISTPEKEVALENLQKGPLDGFFIENMGQLDDEVLFYYSGSPKVLIHQDGLSVADISDISSAPFYRMRIENSRVPSSVEGAGEGPLFNFYLGSGPNDWIEGAVSFTEIELENIKPGLDLIVKNTREGPKWEISLDRGSKAEDLVIQYETLMEMSIRDEHIFFEKDGLKFREGPVEIFQDGERVKMPMHFENGHLSFSTKNIDPDAPLLIDPLLGSSTLLGGNSWDKDPVVMVHPDGGVIVTGTTESTDMYTHSSAYDRTANGIKDIFIYRFDPDLSSALYATYFGGSSYDIVHGATVDDTGNVHIAGYTRSSNLPRTSGAFQSSYQGAGDGFTAKFDSQLGSLSYSTFIGGSSEDWARGIDVDDSGIPYVCGTTRSSDLPATSGCYQSSLKGVSDGFVVKLLADASDATYLTYLGGNGFGDEANDIIVDGLGRAVVAGYAISNDFPTTENAFRNGSGFYMGYVSRFEADGTDLNMSTFLGYGARVNSTAFDIDGNILLAGWTDSISGIFPVTDDAFDKDLAGFQDGFATKMHHSGSYLIGSTFIGDNEQWGQPPDTTEDYHEKAVDITSDKTGRVIVSGLTDSINFPLSPDAYDTSRAKQDAFLMMLNYNLSSMEYSTFLGGSDEDLGSGVSYSDDGWVYLSGHTYSNSASHDFPTTPGAYDTSFNSQYDCFVVRFKMDSFLPGPPGNVSSSFGQTSINLTWDPPLFDGNEPVEDYYIYRGNSPSAAGLLDITEDLNYSDSGLIKGRTYYYRVKARNKVGLSIGYGASSNTPFSIPGRPIISGVEPGSNHINITWMRPADDGGTDDLAYHVMVGTSKSNLSMEFGPVDVNFFDITDLDNGQEYFFAVKAENHMGTGSPSDIRNSTPMGRPTPPRNLRAVVGDGAATLFWDEPRDMGGSPGVTYNVFRYYNSSYSIALKYGLLETSYHIARLKNGETYSYFVSAFNFLGEGTSSEIITVTPFGRITEPYNLTATEFGDRVRLRWDGPNSTGDADRIRYTIYMGTDPMELNVLRTNISSDNHTVHGLTPGVVYYFSIRAENELFNSTLSDIVSIRPLKVPTAPREPSLQFGNSFINLSWSVSEYLGGSENVLYEVHLGETINDMIPLIRILETNYNISDLENGRKYYLSVRAINQKGPSNFSRVLNATPMSVPSPPRLPKYTFGDMFLNITWESPFDNGGSLSVLYNVYLGTNRSNIEPVATGLTERNFLIDDLENGRLYVVGISAYNFMGESELAILTNAAPMTAPTAVEIINATVVEEGLLIRWSHPTDDGGSDVWYYRLFRSVDESDFELLREFGGHVHEYLDIEVMRGTSYSYYVVAETSFGPGPASTVVEEVFPEEEEETLTMDPMVMYGAGAALLLILMVIVIALIARKQKNDRMKRIWSIEE